MDTGYFVRTKSTDGGQTSGSTYSFHEFVPNQDGSYTPAVMRLSATPDDGYVFSKWIASSPELLGAVDDPTNAVSYANLDPAAFAGGSGSYTAVFAPEPVLTEEGYQVSVTLKDTEMGTTLPVNVTFDEVTTSGVSSLTTSASGPTLPIGFQLGDPAKYYDIETTATYEGEIQVVIDYSDVSLTGDPKLLHYEDTDDDGQADTWIDRTVSVNTDNHMIYGTVYSLSPFSIVEMIDIPGMKLDAITQLSQIPTGNRKVDDGIVRAIDHISKSLEAKYWITSIHISDKKIFDEEKKAVKELEKICDDSANISCIGIVSMVIEDLVRVDEMLAQVAYEDAIKSCSVSDHKIRDKIDKELDKCQDEFEKAQKEIRKTKKDGSPDPDYDKAIDHYKKVWEHAQHALELTQDATDDDGKGKGGKKK